MKLLLTFCLASLLPLSVEAARRVGEAQVRSGKNDLPCFTIAEREENRSGSPDFQAVAVTAGERTLWRMTMPRERTFPLASSMCIPYGGRVQALPQTPAAPLTSGVVYTVQLDTRAGKSAAAPLRYTARFCLARQADGNMTVHPVGANERQGRPPPACRARHDRLPAASGVAADVGAVATTAPAWSARPVRSRGVPPQRAERNAAASAWKRLG